ncbi:hypothetical protein diail_11360 [Diaporthe ilicicola]|nr:hypothetical protein diail_11360 [Diaporthe ilicicola]
MAAHDNTLRGNGEPIAVIGSGFRFPGSSNTPSRFWEFLLKPRDVLKRIPDNRFNIDNFYHPDPSHHGTTHVKESYFLDEDHRHFDAGFFNIKPVEVPAIDPQQRLLMEVVYESLEAAGLSIESLAGSSTGVYVGLMCGDYSEHLNSDMNTLPTYTPTGNARSIMSNRISYFFDWHGPSMTIDTACSSSMVAVHQAAQLLRSGDSNVAVAAGSNLILGPGQYVGASGLHMLSADSRSRMWDANGTGYARGEDGDKIECVIRETGVNQDGRTKGITVPNSAAQMDLIAKTYAKAGLDPRDPNQRCQYFEAHGTGTGAGDPREAEAISKSFFHPGERVPENADPLYVGSIKTVIGHCEGTAGIAGLLKASLAIQHGVIPPNLLFNQLHPNIEPFYTNLEVLTSPKPWPTPADGGPRRASVNSFGFGGTNSHIIIESAPPGEINQYQGPASCQFTPFNFSATSEASLRGMLSDYSGYLRLNPDVRLPDLSYTLYARRSEHAVRTSISARSALELQAKIDDLLQTASGGNATSFGSRSKADSNPIRVLAVFTGQSAQWPTMGRELVKNSPHVRNTVQELDSVLQGLPETERPKWTLMEELTCDASESRVHTAAFAQPLSTVIQIILFDLLSSTGIKLQAIVGHSSGEVAVAYAKGYITREEAVKIAYYRGYFSTLCPADKPGAMMAVGTTADDANELCNLPMFQGRLCVAAYNSPLGVTLSGDADAIEQAREALEDEKKFARVLKVDKAYHSPHMKECAARFHEALKGCNIQPRHATKGFMWPSSTYEDTEMRGDTQGDQDLSGPYWVNNLLRPVLFSHAVSSAAAAEGPFDVAIELGPHASLKGPVLQTLQESQKEAMSYHGLLHRGKDDVEAFSDALGSIWSQFSSSRIDFRSFDTLATGDDNRSLIKDLPTYHWDHERLYWHGPRASKVLLGQKNTPNPLLGSRTTDPMEQEIRWRNLLRLSELPWIRGHQLQGQVIYPATAYVATAVEAARFLAPSENIALIEIQDFSLGKPLVFRDDDAGIETLFTLSDIIKDSEDTYSASFTYHACTNEDVEVLSSHATGRVVVTTGQASSRWLPPRPSDPPNLVSVSQDRFYSSLQPLGYSYSGYFKTLSSIQRRLDFSSSNIMVPPQDGEPEKMLLHPALLDSALQGIFLAYCWPGDGSLDQLYVPTGIKSFRVNVGLCKQDLIPDTNIVACSHLTGNPLASKQLHGDVHIYADDGTGLVQIEGVKVVAFAEPTADADKKMFAEHKWGVLNPNCEVAMGGRRATAEDYEFAEAMERVSIDYMRQVTTLFPESVRQSMDLEWHFKCLFEFFIDVIATTRAGTRQFSQTKWLEDTAADIAALKAKFGHKEDMKLACAVGDNLPAVLRGETTILEHLTKDGLLDRFYEVGMGLKEVSFFLGQTVKQVVHRHPRMKMLEIGAGTGGATKVIMGEIGRSFSSYTFTDISTGFFETAQEVFSPIGDKMIFKPLDCEKDIVAQGYEEHSYDLVVASLVLHATTDLRRTLANARRLLKPGGYLVMQEVINNDVSKTGFLMCAMPVEWHRLLLESGFSGVDSSTPEYDVFPFPLAVIVSQAVDDRISLLREPLSSPAIQPEDEDWDLVLIGGQSLGSSQLIEQIIRLAQPLGVRHVVFKTLGDIVTANISPNSAILCVAELDEPVFQRLSAQTLQGMQKVFETQRTVLWITQGSRSEDPYMSMTVGLGRSLLLENPDLVLQFLDLEVGVKPNPRQLLESLLRLRYGSVWEKEGSLEDILWTNEQELASEKGELMVSRLYHDSTLNNRYNACKRTIHETMNPQTVPLSLSSTSSKHSLAYDSFLDAQLLKQHQVTSGSEVLIKVTHSLLMPVLATPLHPSYLVLGINKATGNCLPSIRLEKLVGAPGIDTIRPAIVDWTVSTGVPVQISTVDSQVTFKSDKTYVLFGLTSDLAQSVCDWMASHGARNIVLTSRNPKVDATWIELLGKSGVRLEVFANDITDKNALCTLVDHIRQNFPPIAGIAHGAMVLDDISFFEMPLEKMNKVLQPKVKGAIYLDELFQDDSLDFFVLFSSVTAIAGNRGQSAYSTANMFMTTLATQRRNKGLAASILHIGAHCFQADDGSDRKATEKAVAVSTKVRLVDATTADEILEIVQDAFIQKLQLVLQISAEKDKFQILSSGTDDLGIDSLVAVEIRSWFLKEVETEVPVFKVLSGGSVQQLLEYVVENIPASLTPKRSDTSASLEASATPYSASSSGDPKGGGDTSQLGDKQDKEEASSVTSASTIDSREIAKPVFQKILPISPGQSRFWFQKNLMEDQTTSNSTICVSIDGKIRLDNLESAVQNVAARHEALRTSFFMDEDHMPVQAIVETSRLFLERIVLTDESRVAQEFERLKRHVYDIEHGDCMRLVHITVTPTKGFLLIGSHHIIMDGISLEVLLNDLQKAYNGQLLPERVYQYTEYSEKLRKDLLSGSLQEEIKYWKSEFASPPVPLPLLPFSAVKRRSTLAAYDHNSVSRTIDSKLAKQIQDTCRQLKANVFHFHLGVFEVLLFKLFGNSDVCIGMADANRSDDQVAKSIGMYLNLLPLRFHLDGQQSFEKLLKDTRTKAYLAMANSRLPFDILLDNVDCERSTAISPLFQAFINYRQGISEKHLFNNAAAEIRGMSLPRSGYDISLDIIENPGSDTRVTFMLQQKLYPKSDATRLLDMYFKLLEDFSRSYSQTLQQCSLFAEQDVSNAIQLGKGPMMQSKWPETLVHRIEDVIAKHPDKVALKVSGGNPWTYKQLDAKVDQIASALLQANTKRGSIVAVFQEASPHSVCSLLAILRIGAVYVPLDTNVPPARLGVMVAECKPTALLINTTTLTQVEKLELSSPVITLDVSSLAEDKTANRAVALRPSDPAAILFTSGSTGIPKGVVLSHDGLCNHVEALTYTHGFRSETVLQQSSVGFDMSLNQIFMALANGGTLIIVPETLRKDPVAVSRILLEQEVTYTSATPSEYLSWVRHGSDSLFQSKFWTYATAGGEQFPSELLQAFRKLKSHYGHSFHAFNAYGPTECSMSSNEVELNLSSQDGQHIPAGKTLPNYSVYIMDQNLNVVPAGIPGEICIAGAGVAIEYLNNPDDSARKFLKDPLASISATQKGWDRMYRTGDQGVLRPDGTLQVLGRIDGDTQIKLRGLRIELRDIELSIRDAAKGQIKEVIVTPRGDPTILIAHAILSPNANKDREFLRQLAASLPLPQYMRPAAIIPIDSMPLNSSGKIDRKAFRNIPVTSATHKATPTRELTDTESTLAEIWREVLPQQMEEMHAIDAASDFFHVGGNSMLLIELRRLVNKKLQLDLPMIRLFENSTLGAMAITIQNTSTDQDMKVDWEVETEVPNEFSQLSSQPATVRSHTSNKTIVLTGSTGFLGSHLLRLLAQAPDVEKIQCIAVRDSNKLADYANSEKVVLHSGDLSLPRCGLSEAEAKSIFDSADAIIHNGADVSFLKTYSSLKAPNFYSTKELVRLALPRRIPVHFVSSATVGKFNMGDTLAPQSLAAFTPDTSFASGYAASKWASEVFLEKASRQLGLLVFIHRPSSIMGDEAGDDIMSNVLEYGSIIKALPDSSRWTGYVDLVSLDNVASGIARSALQQISVNDLTTGVEYLHHAGDQVIPVQKIKELLNGDGGIQLASLPMREWVGKAVEQGMNPLVGEFLRNADEGQGLQIGQKLLLRKD